MGIFSIFVISTVHY
ncbi:MULTISPECIES: erythromycin resistance leader peptide, partial [Bacteria]|nr:23S rRNA methylase leader peptide ErmCL [Staphylococcus aureus]MQH13657.1 23S rRNA methylase leader peptide ErmCL [Escherichia coli]